MGKKRKTLPKNFQDLIDTEDIAVLKEVLVKCDVNAYGGYGKHQDGKISTASFGTI